MPEWPDVARRGPSARSARRGPTWPEMPECRNGTTWFNVAQKPERPDVARRGPKYRAPVPPALPGCCCRATTRRSAASAAPQRHWTCLGAAAAPPRAAALQTPRLCTS
eukprot:scaffold3649_cov27-Phaeocystis_antarctica.AAC.1